MNSKAWITTGMIDLCQRGCGAYYAYDLFARKGRKLNQLRRIQCDRAKSPLPGFRNTCRARVRSYHPLNPMLPAKSRTCSKGPFGELLRATGPMAKANPFSFSTKYQDDETDLPYYGYRYLNALTGRWIS
jgi:hypothetical protein